MSATVSESLSKTTFRFSSGQILTLTESQIGRIPYLSALVSSADDFESLRDDDGYLKLDQNIKYEDFILVIKSFPFHSIRQLFTDLSKETNIIPIIALCDFLGLHTRPNPTLNEVDFTFFSNVMYDPSKENYIRLIKPPIMQEVAVRFAIAIVKEEYDFSKDEVIDHIYWLTTFVLSAYKYFGTNLRHHMYTIAENCFTVFKYSQLNPLKRLKERMDYDAKKQRSRNFKYCEDNTGDDFHHSEVIYSDYYPQSNQFTRRSFLKNVKLNFSDESYYGYDDQFRFELSSQTDEEILEPAHTSVLKIVYERLQEQIYQCSSTILHDHKNVSYTIKSLIECELVQREIRELVLEELITLTAKIKNKHIELQQKLQSYKNRYNEWTFSPPNYEIYRRGIVRYALLVDKLNHDSSIIVEQLQQRVSKSLSDVVLEQLFNRLKTQREIDELRESLAAECSPRDFLSAMSRKTCQHYQTPKPKLMSKRQPKYSKR